MRGFETLLAKAKAQITEITAEAVRARPPGTLLIDCRQREEIAQGRIEGALDIPRGLLEDALPRVAPDKDQPILFYCAGGTRSALAAWTAHALGYTQTSSMIGGFGRWKQIGAPFHIAPMSPFPSEPEASPVPTSDFPTLTPETLSDALSSNAPPLILDVREPAETAQGHIPNARLEPRGFLELRIETEIPKDAPIVLISSLGARAFHAAKALRSLGYTTLSLLEGGFRAWELANKPIEVPRRLSPMDQLRYSRHLRIPEIGEHGQLQLLASKVLLMGAGGLGSPAAYYLAAAGVGTLGIIDSDVVDRSNLQRQILHTDARIGTPKVDSAKQTLLALNPDITVEAIDARLTRDNVLEVFEGYDLVIDGGDNFPTRYLINDACVRLGIPCVHGSVYRFEGQVSVFAPGRGPCYRCLYPAPPPPELAPSCADAGVLGVVPGIIGLLQANEAIKLLLGIGAPLIGRLLHFDALAMAFRELKLGRDPACSVCSEGAQWHGFIDYEHFCKAD